jgi:hypothetical protein
LFNKDQEIVKYEDETIHVLLINSKSEINLKRFTVKRTLKLYIKRVKLLIDKIYAYDSNDLEIDKFRRISFEKLNK